MIAEDKFYEGGLGTNLRPKSKTTMKVSDQLESVLTQLERELLSIGWEIEMPEKKDKDKEMRSLLISLSLSW